MIDDLARRGVACKGWRWLPGMLTTDGARLLFEDRVLGWQAWSLDRRRHTLDCTGAFPDLTDPATVGCLLALVRESGAYVWNVCMPPMVCTVNVEWADGRICDYRRETLAESLVAALEAAP